MFQYAIGQILSQRQQTELFLDIRFFDQDASLQATTPRDFEINVFNNDYKIANKEVIKGFFNPDFSAKIKRKLGLNYPKIFNETKMGYNEEIFNYTSPLYLSGYFQSYKYYRDHEDFIRSLFRFPKEELKDRYRTILEATRNTNSVSVHIRRGDYINDASIQRIHGNCDKNYYLKAIQLICEKVENPKFYFFSDEPEWVEKEFWDLTHHSEFIDSRKEQSWVDMFLMSECKHHIIANSSYSWWAAWLNRSRNKTVIAPKNWFALEKLNKEAEDLLPEDWHHI